MRDYLPRTVGELETEVLSLLWEGARALSVRQVQDEMPLFGLAYTTVQTVLSRLHAKELVSRERVGAAFVYRARVTRESWYSEQAARALLAAPSDGTLTALLDAVERSNPKVVERLAALLAARRGARG